VRARRSSDFPNTTMRGINTRLESQ
jgi:hypothetical protein